MPRFRPGDGVKADFNDDVTVKATLWPRYFRLNWPSLCARPQSADTASSASTPAGARPSGRPEIIVPNSGLSNEDSSKQGGHFT